MRFLPLLALPLCMAACRSRIPREDAREVYAEIGLSALPGVGASATFGQVYSDGGELFDFALELGATLQDVDAGRFFQVQLGIKQTASPGYDHHLIFRYGLTWFRATGTPDLIDLPGDYIGLYLGVGYEWELSRHITVGPEARVVAVDGEGSLGSEVIPQFAFHFIFNF